MDKSTDDVAIKRTAKVVPIDGGAKKQQSAESIAPEPDKAGIAEDEKSSEVFDQFLDKMKARNVANRKSYQSTGGGKKH